MNTLESPRLLFKEIQSTDFDFLYQFHSDAKQTQYLPLEKPYPKKEVEQLLKNRIKHWKTHGFGTYILFLKTTQTPIGYCGLEYVKDTEYIDIRYGIVKEQGGKGLAAEAASHCLQWGFSELKLPIIYGAAVPENKPSVAILKKLGMTPAQDVFFYGDVVDYFSIKCSNI